jgi:cyclophilin family peptidyl-prolyl cis-trans isomerase
VVVVDQPALDGQFTVFGHVSDGMEVVQKISETPVDDKGVATERVEIRHVTIRDTPPPAPEPFSTESVAELSAYHAVLETSAGAITIEVFPDKAPIHVRQFLRLVQAGVYDGMAFHRVAPGFVIQTGALASRAAPLTEKLQKIVRIQRHQACEGHRVDGPR